MLVFKVWFSTQASSNCGWAVWRVSARWPQLDDVIWGGSKEFLLLLLEGGKEIEMKMGCRVR